MKADAFNRNLPQPIDYRPYMYLFLLSIVTRALFLIYIDEPILFYKYPYFAEKLVQGEDIGERLADLSPFYLYFLSFIKKIFNPDWTFVKTFQSVIGAFNGLILFRIGTRFFNRETGILSALIYSAYGNLIILESTLEPTVFILLFNLLTLLFLDVSKDRHRSYRYRASMIVAAGLTCGLSIITKPNFLLFLPLGISYLLFHPPAPKSLKPRIWQSLLFIGISALVILPITVRNYIKFNEFILVTADAGKVFYHGNGKGASALEGVALADEGFLEEGAPEPDYAHHIYRATARKLSGKKLSPSESSKFWFKKTMADITADPKTYLKRLTKKGFYFFNDYEMHYIASAYKEYKETLVFPFIRYGVIMSLALLGMAISIRSFDRHFLIYGMILLYLVSGMLFLVQSRYRLPAVPYLCLFAGFAVVRIKGVLVSKKNRNALAYLTIIILSFVSVRFLYRVEIQKMEQWQEATKIHYQMDARPAFQSGQYQLAITHLGKCLALAPNFSPAYNLRGKCFAVLGRYEKAETDFLTVIDLKSGWKEGYKNLGFLFLIRKMENKAKPYLIRAASLAPNDTEVKNALNDL